MYMQILDIAKKGRLQLQYLYICCSMYDCYREQVSLHISREITRLHMFLGEIIRFHIIC